MLVDDDALVLESMVILLEDNGFNVLSFTNAAETIDSIKLVKPNVCLVDLNLSNYSGEILIQEILALSPDTRCLIYSGFCYKLSPELKQLGLSQNDVIQKPIVDFEQLVKKIANK